MIRQWCQYGTENKNGRHQICLAFLSSISKQLILEREFQPKVDLSVSIDAPGDIHKVTISQTVRIQAAAGVREQIRMVENVQEFQI
jgi:hypothetical protein